MTPILHIFRGLPGSGKTTAAEELNLDHHYEADQWFDLYNGGRFDHTKLPIAHLWCQSNVAVALCNQMPVSVANTFVTAWEIRPYVEAARLTKAIIHIHTCNYPGKSVHNVPESTIQRMRNKWEDFTVTPNYEIKQTK